MQNTLLGTALVLMSVFTHGVSAVERIEEPLSFRHSINWKSDSALLLGPLNMHKIGVEDRINVQKGLPLRVAIKREESAPQEYELKGEWSTIDDMSVWRLRVEADDAQWLSLTFENLFLPPGASLYLYDQSHQKVVGPFTDKDNKASRKLWTPMVLGESAYVEINVPTAMKPYLSFNLKSVNQGYRGFKSSKDGSTVGACNIDVVCPQGDDWRDEIRSVASYVFEKEGGFFTCTGSLVNNVEGDRKSFFMTANHCVSTAAHAQSMVFYWNLQKSMCGGPNDGSLSQTQTGATLLATVGEGIDVDKPMDMTLVELDLFPDQQFDVYFAGWDTSSEPPTSGVSIHHPNREEKRISLDSGPVIISDFGFRQPDPDGKFLQIGAWDEGTTEGGSSGAGLWNQDKRIVGVLSGGGASCDDIDQPDFYAHLASHYNVGTTSASRLKDWLDPADTGTTRVDGIEGCEAPVVSFTSSANPAEAGVPVTFTATIEGPPGSGTTYAWDFDGDGLVDSTDVSPTFTYPDAYMGNIDLTVTDSLDCSGSSRAAIVVLPGGGNSPPVAVLTASQTSAEEGATVELSASGSTDENGDDLTYSWVQTAGPVAARSSSVGETIFVVLPSVNSDDAVTLQVIVSDEFGATDSESVSIAVVNVNRSPVAAVSDSVLTVDEGQLVSLNAGNSSDPDGDTLGFSWSQTSGATVSLNNSAAASASFTAPQVSTSELLNFTVTVTDAGGLSDSTTVRVTVNDITPAPPQAPTPAPTPVAASGGGGGGALGWPLLGLLLLIGAARRIRRRVGAVVIVSSAVMVAACSTAETSDNSLQPAVEVLSTPVIQLVRLGKESERTAITNAQDINALTKAFDKRQRRYEKIRPIYEYELHLDIGGVSEVWNISPSGYMQKPGSYELYKMDMTTLKAYVK
ncbi:MAG: PKD domain-containing protein [Gammaproteobacteria bacterium]